MDQHRIGPGRVIGLGAAQRLIETVAGDQRLDAGDEREFRLGLAVLAGLDAAAELVDRGKRLRLAEEGVGLGEQLVLDADAGDAALAELADEAPDIVEIAIAGIAVDQDRQRRRIGHEFEDVEHLRPRRLVVVAHAERRRDRQPGRPDAGKSGFLDKLGREAVMRLHQEREFWRDELATQGGAAARRLRGRVLVGFDKIRRQGHEGVTVKLAVGANRR